MLSSSPANLLTCHGTRIWGEGGDGYLLAFGMNLGCSSVASFASPTVQTMSTSRLLRTPHLPWDG